MKVTLDTDIKVTPEQLWPRLIEPRRLGVELVGGCGKTSTTMLKKFMRGLKRAAEAEAAAS